MMRHLTARAVASTLIFTFGYSPLLGGLTGTLAAAQAETAVNYEYDPNGNVIRETDALGHAITTVYDKLNRPTQRARGVGAAANLKLFEYDGQNRLSRVTDPRGLPTTYNVDGLGNRLTAANADQGAVSKTYDAAGNVLTSTDALGKMTRYGYDQLNRVLSITYASGAVTRFEYSAGPFSLLTKVTDASGSTSYAYDQDGRLSTLTQMIARTGGTVTRVTRYAYLADGSGRLLSMTYPSGHQVTYLYKSTGALDTMVLSSLGMVLVKNIAYRPFGPAQSWTWGNDSSNQPNLYVRTFDLDGRAASYPLGSVSKGGVVRRLRYDAASRLASITHVDALTGAPAAALDQGYAYDELDRLTGVVSATGSQNYAYDAGGNRTELKLGANRYVNTVNPASNRLTMASGPTFKFNTFDAAGNVLSDTQAAYAYTEAGQLRSVWKSSTDNATYTYNGLGQRVSKLSAVLASGANVYSYDGAGHLLGEYDANGVPLQETVYLGDQPVAVIVPRAVGEPAVFHVYADEANTPRVITRTTDNMMVWRWDNTDPFGVSAPLENPAGAGTFVYNPRFAGQLYDRETNTFYSQRGTYDPQTGRYLQGDPAQSAAGANPYEYVGAAPVGKAAQFDVTLPDPEPRPNLPL